MRSMATQFEVVERRPAVRTLSFVNGHREFDAALVSGVNDNFRTWLIYNSRSFGNSLESLLPIT